MTRGGAGSVECFNTWTVWILNTEGPDVDVRRSSGEPPHSGPLSRDAAELAEDGGGDFAEGDDLLGRVKAHGFPRHSVDHAAGLVLRDGPGAALFHLQHPAGAVAPHSGQQDADGPGTGGLGHGAEHDVHGRPMVADAGAILDGDPEASAG